MSNQFSRTELLLGSQAIAKLNNSRVAVFGIGGVGGHIVEALVRSGIGAIDIVDNDIVNLSNINRQIIATHSTVGKYKVDVCEERMLDINPNVKITKHRTFFTPETSSTFDFSKYDYVADAIDTVSGKIELIVKAQNANTPVISSMGAGNKLNPTMFEVEDIYKTSVCPLARVMRSELKKRGVKSLKVVYSKEKPIKPNNPIQIVDSTQDSTKQKPIPASNAFVPSVAGLIIASEIIKDLVAE
jgi:tRNA A37 threonylcarbamoyladenosine dehydratase